MDLLNLLNVTWTPLNVMLLVLTGVGVFFGFFIMYKEIKIIKQKNVKKREIMYALVFGVIFSAAAMLGVVIVIQYVSTASIFTGTPSTSILLPRFTSSLFLLLSCVLLVYPLMEFIALALEKKQGSPFKYQEVVFKYLSTRIKSVPGRIAVATAAYLAVFHAVPLLLQLLGVVPYFLSLLILMQFFPVFLLSRLGSQGYFWGVNLHYYNIFEKERLVYAAFEDPKRVLKTFKESPIPMLALPVMVFTYFNTFYSLVQMFFLFDTTITAKSLNFTFVFSTTMNVLFQLVGFYNRYWKKQVKYKMTEIMFAGYLFSSLSINIFLNFLVKQPDVLLSALSVVMASDITSDTYRLLIPVAMVQKLVFVFLVTYFLLSKKGFKTSVLKSIMMQASSRLNPKPLASLMRHKDEAIRTEATALFVELYRQHSMRYIPPPLLPGKRANPLPRMLSGLLTSKRKQVPFEPAFDMLDSDVLERRRAATRVVAYMVKDDPERAVPIVNERLVKGNEPEQRALLEALNLASTWDLPGLDINQVVSLAKDGGILLSSAAFEYLSRAPTQALIDAGCQEQLELAVRTALNNPCAQVACSALATLKRLDPERVQARVLHALALPRDGQQDTLADHAPVSITDMFTVLSILDDRKPDVLLAALHVTNLLPKGDAKGAVPIDTFSRLLRSRSVDVVQQAALLYLDLHKMYPADLPFDPLVPILQSGNMRLVEGLLVELLPLARDHPRELLPVLGAIITGPAMEMKNTAKACVVEIGKKDLTLVLNWILNMKEESKFSVRNFTREILVDLGLALPERVVPVLQSAIAPGEKAGMYGSAIAHLGSRIEGDAFTKESFRVNAAAVLGEIGEQRPDQISIDLLFRGITNEDSWRVRKELAASLGRIMVNVPDFPVTRYMELLGDKNTNVRAAVITGLEGLARERPAAFPIGNLASMLEDPDDMVREQAMKIVALVAPSQPGTALPFLISGLKDEKWPVRNVAAEGLGKLPEGMELPAFLRAMLKDSLLHDKDEWARWQAGRTLIQVVQQYPDTLMLDDLAGNVEVSDEKMAIVHATLLRHVVPEPMDKFLATIQPLMASPNERIQEQVTTTLYHVHGKTNSDYLLGELLKMVVDEGTDVNVLHCAAITLGKMAKYDTSDLKKRVKKVLGTRAKLSRDFVLSREFSAL